jgi:hypothetical protein
VSFHAISSLIISCHIKSYHVILCVIGLFGLAFNKDGRSRGRLKICLPRSLPIVSLSGQSQKLRIMYKLSNPPPLQLNCTSYSCYTRTHAADLRQLDLLPCHSKSDCHHMETGLVCNKYDGGRRGFCECPRKAAFNTTSCQCQRAQECPREETGARPTIAGN